MSLAYVDLSRDAMALSPPDFIKGSELLEIALKLLQVNMDENSPCKSYSTKLFLFLKFGTWENGCYSVSSAQFY